MGKYLKQGFVRALEWQHAREEISYSKMVDLMEEECIKNYLKSNNITEQGLQYCEYCKKDTWHTPKLGLVMQGKRLCDECSRSNYFKDESNT